MNEKKKDILGLDHLYFYDGINFKEGETVLFEESQVEGAITTVDASSFDITSSFDGENGQKEDFYNYST